METVLATPIPCLVDGKPAEIIGYGDANAGPAIDYRFIGEQTIRWLYAGSSRLEMTND